MLNLKRLEANNNKKEIMVDFGAGIIYRQESFKNLYGCYF
jgi:hypothetical protein